jgi:hypothetical protein
VVLLEVVGVFWALAIVSMASRVTAAIPRGRIWDVFMEES